MKKFVAIAAATLVSAVVVAAPSKKHEVVETTAATTTATTSSAPATTDTGILAPATASAASNLSLISRKQNRLILAVLFCEKSFQTGINACLKAFYSSNQSSSPFSNTASS